MNATEPQITIATALATQVDAADTAERLAERLRIGLGGRNADVCLVFASAHFEDGLAELVGELHERLAGPALVGLTAESVISGNEEYESQPALAVWAAWLPEPGCTSFHLSEEDLERLETPAELREYLNVPTGARPSFILLSDPYSFSPRPALLTLLERLEAAYPGRPAIGGLASAADEPGQNRLVFDGQTLRHGLVGVALWGPVEMDTVVSQGCRPIGRHMVVTRADGNVIYELGGKPPLEVVKELVLAAAPRERRLLQRRGLLVGAVINEYQKKFAQGDFLIRNPIGFDASSGAMAINDLVRTGQTVQFQVRDEDSATQDLDELLAPAGRRRPAGALLFTCSARGTHLFKERSHDARMISDACGAIPTAGCFAAGEIGPVGRRNFLHGHTASVGFFRARGAASHD